jgi:hypothetical protein
MFFEPPAVVPVELQFLFLGDSHDFCPPVLDLDGDVRPPVVAAVVELPIDIVTVARLVFLLPVVDVVAIAVVEVPVNIPPGYVIRGLDMDFVLLTVGGIGLTC